MQKILLSILMLIGPLLPFSQAIVQGKVINAISRQPLEGATVKQVQDEKTTHLLTSTGNFQ